MKKTFKTLTFILAFTLVVLCGALLLYGCSPQTPALTESPSKPAETQESMTSATETQTDPYDYGITVTVDSNASSSAVLVLYGTEGEAARQSVPVEEGSNTFFLSTVVEHTTMDRIRGW